MPEATKPRLTAQTNFPTLVGSMGIREQSPSDKMNGSVTVSKGARANDWISRVDVDVRNRTIDPVDSNEPHFETRGPGDLLCQLC